VLSRHVVFAEFETNLRRERQLEGIAKAKAAGVYKGRPPSIEASRVRELKAQGMRLPAVPTSRTRPLLGRGEGEMGPRTTPQKGKRRGGVVFFLDRDGLV
jgi:DNA invertase Pin-like site-specific DNA recombinase